VNPRCQTNTEFEEEERYATPYMNLMDALTAEFLTQRDIRLVSTTSLDSVDALLGDLGLQSPGSVEIEVLGDDLPTDTDVIVIRPEDLE